MTDTTQPQGTGLPDFRLPGEDTLVKVNAVPGRSRAGIVDFNGLNPETTAGAGGGGKGPVISIPLNNGNVGVYKYTTDSEGNHYLSYAVYSSDNKVVEGTHVRLDSNYEEYRVMSEAAMQANPGAYRRGKGKQPGSENPFSDTSSEDEGFDPFRPWKGSQAIISDKFQAQLSTDGDVVGTAVPGSSVQVFMDMDDAWWVEVLSSINDAQKNIIKEHLGLPSTHTLTIENLKAHAEADSAFYFTFVRKDGTVRSFQYINSLQGTVENRAVSKEMRFNILTGRGSYLQNSDSYIGQDFIVTDRAPLDYIKYLSQQEPWPTTVFQDSRTGEFWYVPRGMDVSGLRDPKRFNRTYFFRQYPEDISGISPGTFRRNNPHIATMLHSFREEQSSVATRTNILVQSQAPKAMSGNEGQYLLISVMPRTIEGEYKAYAASFFTVTDNTATQNPGALIATALAYARQVGKELKAGAATVLGDPSIVPGEAIQIIGSPAHQGYANSIEKINADRERFLDMAVDYERFYSKLPDVIRTYTPGSPPDLSSGKNFIRGRDPDTDPDLEPSPTEDSPDKMFMDAAQNVQEINKNVVSFMPEPPTMWRVEAVIDKFNDGVDGYYTELSLMSCF